MSWDRSSSRGAGSHEFRIPWAWVIPIALLIVPIVVYAAWNVFFGYVWYGVDANHVGVQFDAGQPYAVKGPGRWTEMGIWRDIKSIDISGRPFTVTDEEVLTKDQQRLGVTMSGTVHRPGVDKSEILLANWASYSNFYLDDGALVGNDKVPGLMQRLGQQAMKVCVGDLPFNEAVVGSARDVLRGCIDTETDKLAKGYGLEVRNIVVPNIILGKEVQQKLDDITNAKFATLEAQQNELKAKADAARDLAVQQGKIMVEQGQVQEKAKQDATTAQLNKAALDAQNAVISAQKANDLLTAEKDLEIAKVKRAVADENAKAAVASDLARAQMLDANPAYTSYLTAQAWSAAYSRMDKVILPPNVSPFMFIGDGASTQPTVTLPVTQGTGNGK